MNISKPADSRSKPLTSNTDASWPFHTARGLFDTTSQTTIHPSASAEINREFRAQKCKAWIGDAWPRRIYRGVAGGWVSGGVTGICLMFGIQRRRNSGNGVVQTGDSNRGR